MFDKSRFLSRLDGDEVLGKEIIAMFLQEYPKLLANVHQAAEQRNPSVLERAAHSLKGSVGDIAAPEATEAARILEATARAGKLDEAETVLKTLDNKVNRLVCELRGVAE